MSEESWDFEAEATDRYREIVSLLNDHEIPVDAATGRALHQLAFVAAHRVLGLDIALKMFSVKVHDLA